MNQFNSIAEQLLKSVRRMRNLILLFQCILILLSVLLFWKGMLSLEEKYLISLTLPGLILLVPAVLLLLIQSFLVYRRESSRLRISARIDQRFDLKNRFSTYVEFREKDHPFFPALANDLGTHLTKTSMVGATDFRSGMAEPVILLLTLILIVSVAPFLPVPASIVQKKQEKEQVARAAEKFAKAIQSFPKAELNHPKIKTLLDSFEKSAKELQGPETDRTTVLKNFNALQQKLEKTRSDILDSSEKEFSKKIGKMANMKPGNVAGPAIDPREAARLTEDLAEALNQKDPIGQEIADAIRSGRLSREDAEKLKKSLEEYKAERAESERKLADLQEKLENSRKGVVSGKGEVTYDSTLKDRDIQKSKGGVEDGPGTTNLDMGPQHFDTKKKNKGKYVEDRTRAKYEKLYKGQREDTAADPLFVNSQWGEKSKYSRVRTFGLQSESSLQGGSTLVDGQDEEESAISKENIPASYREMVKQYLDSIQH